MKRKQSKAELQVEVDALNQNLLNLRLDFNNLASTFQEYVNMKGDMEGLNKYVEDQMKGLKGK